MRWATSKADMRVSDARPAIHTERPSLCTCRETPCEAEGAREEE